jgi:hypothetical protein
MSNERLQQVDIPPEEDSKEEMVETSPRSRTHTFTSKGKGDDYNNHDKRSTQCYNCIQFGHYNTEFQRKASLKVHE